LDTQRILHEVEAEITKLQSVANVLRGLALNNAEPQSGQKVMSAAARRKISIAQKLRRAKRATNSKNVNTAKPKRTMSASARRKIAAAQRMRWAKSKTRLKKAA
jgi:hypothetical protein